MKPTALREDAGAPLPPHVPLPAFPDPDAERIDHAFRIADRWWRIPPDLPAEVMPAAHCARLPFTRDWCLGLASFRGDLAPVYDLGAWLSTGATPTAGRYFLVLGRRPARAALRIDEIKGFAIPHDAPVAAAPPLPGLASAFAGSGPLLDGIVYADIDLIALLARLAVGASLLEPGDNVANAAPAPLSPGSETVSATR